MSGSVRGARAGTFEFVALIAAMMALTAFAVDIMLPALSDIRDHYGVADRNAGQLLVVWYLMAFGLSQPLFGPLTDRFGRRALLFWALSVYAGTAFYCMFAPGFEGLLVARILQGVASGIVRVIAISTVRDVSSGRAMARTMSMVMMVFMVVPIVAPAIGQAIMVTSGAWQPIFLGLAAYAALVLAWSHRRLAETLPAEKRIGFSAAAVMSAYFKVLTNRQALGYGLGNGLVFGTLFNFVATSEQIFDDIYDAGTTFPAWFAGCGVAMVVANLVNARFVIRIGMRRLSLWAVIGLLVSGAAHAAIAYGSGGSAPFAIFYPLVLTGFFCVALTGPNFNSLAMEKLGRVAGTAAAMLGFVSTFLASALGWAIGRAYDGRTDTLFACHAALAAATLLILAVTERGWPSRPRAGRAGHALDHG